MDHSAYWDSEAVAARQLANAPVWIKTTTDELTVLLFCDLLGVTLNLLQCLHAGTVVS